MLCQEMRTVSSCRSGQQRRVRTYLLAQGLFVQHREGGANGPPLGLLLSLLRVVKAGV